MAVQLEKSGARIYLTGDTFAIKDRIKSIGGHWDGDRRAWWVGSAKAEDAAKLVESLANQPDADPNAPRPKQDPNDIRLSGKGVYKGRTYYLSSRTRDGIKVRCLTLPDANGEYLDFWAAVAEVQVVKTYGERTSGYGRYARTEYTTLGGIAAFVRRQQSGEPKCPGCGLVKPLVYDHEDGIAKCHSCCDMPAD